MRASALILALAIPGACVAQSAAPERAVFGRWQVTASACPTDCAMSRTAAESWRGRAALYEDSIARFGEHSCKRPRYIADYWPGEGVYGGARLKDLGIRDDSALVIDIECPSESRPGADPRWTAPGSFLIVRDRDHLLMVWEGVFFELSRDRSRA